MSQNYVMAEDLSTDFTLDVGAQKIKVTIDGATIKRDAVTNALYVDSAALAIGPSIDAGNMLVNGSDGRLFMDAEVIQDAVGVAVANGLGIEYDDAMNAFKVAIGNMVANDTDSVDMTLDMSTVPTTPALTAVVKLDTTLVGNLLKLTAGQGLGVAPTDVLAVVEPATTFDSAIDASVPAAPVLKDTLTVNGVAKVGSTNLDAVNNAFGVFQGVYTVKA